MMNTLLPLFQSLAASVTWADLGWLAARLVLVASAGHLLLALTSRASAATRHGVALAALLAVALLPMASAIAPRWSLPIWPAGWSAAAPMPLASREPGRPPSDRPAAPEGVGPQSLNVEYADTSAAARASASSPPTPRSHPAGARGPMVAVLAAFAVATLLLARLAAGFLAAHRLVREARPVRDYALLRELADACDRLSVWEAIELRLSPRVGVPVISGWLAPVLLLPVEAMEWTPARRATVFLHEVAHVRRRDPLALFVARIVTALLWFHPLVWTLARVARRECERACDDVVLSRGVRASDYADDLLAIARAASQRPPLPGATLAFARASSLETRLIALLRAGGRRGPVSGRALTGTAIAMTGVLLGAASVRVVAAPIAKRSGPPKQAAAAWARKEDGANTVIASQPAHLPSAVALPAGSASPASDPATDAVVAESSRSGEAWWDRAKEQYDRERYAAAAESYRRAARAGYRPGTAWYNAACSYALDDEKEPALDALQQALDAGFDRVELLQSDSDLNSLRDDERFRRMARAALHSDVGVSRRRGADAQYEALRESGSSDAGNWKSVGMTLLRSGDPARAAEAFDRQYRIDQSPNAIYNRACAQAQAGDDEAALATLQRAIEAGAGNGEMLRKDSDLIPLRHDARFDRLVELASDLEIRHRGMDDRDRQAWRAEVPRYERVAERHPDLGRAWFNLGYVRLRARDAEGGREAFAKSLDLGYRRPTTLYNLACAAAQAGDRDAAFRWLDQAQAAGMKLEEIAPGDDDLDPLRSDARFQAMEDRWNRDRERAKWNGKEKEKEKAKDKKKSDDDQD